MSGWKISDAVFGNGTSYRLEAEIMPDHFDALREQSTIFSKQIIEQEEQIILTGMGHEALLKLKYIIEKELIARGLQ